MRQFLFVLGDGLRSVKRSPASFTITFITISLSLFLIAGFYTTRETLVDYMNSLRSNFALEIFLHDSSENNSKQEIGRRLQKFAGIDSVNFVSKEQALIQYKRRFGREYLDLIEGNPLPSSYQLFLANSHLKPDSIKAIAKKIGHLAEVNSVVYSGPLIEALNEYYSFFNAGFLIFGFGLGLISFVLISNNIKLSIRAKSNEIQTMKLVGATQALIQGPFYVLASLEGFTGAVGAYILLLLVVKLFNWFIPGIVKMPAQALFYLILVGIVYGVAGCVYALRRRV